MHDRKFSISVLEWFRNPDLKISWDTAETFLLCHFVVRSITTRCVDAAELFRRAEGLEFGERIRCSYTFVYEYHIIAIELRAT